jgi:chemotaxis protein CheX
METTLIGAVSRATREVVSGALSWKVSAGRLVSRPVNSSTSEASAIVGLVGAVQGTVTLKCTRRIAQEATRAMLGVDADCDSPQVRDAVGEVLNMIVGQAKTYYSLTYPAFAFTLPTCIMGDNYQIYIRATPGARVGAIYFLCPLGPFSVEVYMKSQGPSGG